MSWAWAWPWPCPCPKAESMSMSMSLSMSVSSPRPYITSVNEFGYSVSEDIKTINPVLLCVPKYQNVIGGMHAISAMAPDPVSLSEVVRKILEECVFPNCIDTILHLPSSSKLRLHRCASGRQPLQCHVTQQPPPPPPRFRFPRPRLNCMYCLSTCMHLFACIPRPPQ